MMLGKSIVKKVRSIMKELFIARLKTHLEDLYVEDLFSVSIKGHLYCESALYHLIEEILPYPEHINISRLDYQAKVNLCCALGAVPERYKPSLTHLGKLRNKFSHVLNFSLSEEDEQDFMNLIKSTLGEPVQFLFNTNFEFLSNLRRCVIGLWLALEGALAQRNGYSDEIGNIILNLYIEHAGVDKEGFLKFFKNRTVQKYGKNIFEGLIKENNSFT